MFTPNSVNQPIQGDIIRSYRPPTDIEASHTRSFIELEQLELERYDTEISRTRKVLEKLEQERKLLQQRLEERRSWLAPIRRLPPEVLENIFCFAQSGYSYSLRIEGKEFQSTVYAISQVCLHWRCIVVTQPKWWNRISVDVYQFGENLLPQLEQYLEFSGQSELEVHIEDSQSYSWYHRDPEGCETFTEHLGTADGIHAFDILLRHARRFQDLSVDIPTAVFDDARDIDKLPEFPIKFVAFPLLHSFTFTGETDDLDFWFFDLKMHTPILNELIIFDSSGRSWCAWHTRGSVTLPYRQLRQLTISQVQSCTVLLVDILPRCHEVERLELDFSRKSSLEPVRWDMVELANVQHLSLSYDNPTGYEYFLRAIKLPALESFALEPDSESYIELRWPCCHFLDMVRRSAADMEDIDIDYPNAKLLDKNGSGLFMLMRLCPNLGALHIRVRNSDTLLASFQKLADFGTRFPGLTDVVIETLDTTSRTEEGRTNRKRLRELLGRITPHKLAH
ncbi:hypothetical protein VNI00_007773 [Paramarasmius palmivorus]|uniref:F-box domain-containing protein n=1 Tax=Paramarasmius palmivorus TaxID=297713 RepID=A0AAW0CY12_9AGAR